MTSLTTIASPPASAPFPHTHISRAKEAQRFDENLAQSLATKTGDAPQQQRETPPSQRPNDLKKHTETSREAHTTPSRALRSHQVTQEKNAETSRDPEIATVPPENPHKRKAAEAIETDPQADPKIEANNEFVPEFSEPQSDKPDSIATENAFTDHAQVNPPASIVSGAKQQSGANKEHPITKIKTNSKLLNSQANGAEIPPRAVTDDDQKVSSISVTNENETQRVTDQEDNGSVKEALPNTDATKPHIIALTPQSRSALLKVNKNASQPTQIDAAYEGDPTTPHLINETLSKIATLPSASLQSQSRQSMNEATSPCTFDAFQTSFHETSQPDPVSTLPSITPDQNAPLPNPASQALPTVTASLGVPPQPVMGRMNHLPIPYARVPMEIGLAALDGQRSIHVRLSPADLGTIEIELDVSDQSEIQARIAADDPRTLAMLRQDAPLIRQALEQTGLSTHSDSLNFSLRQDGQSNNRQNPEDRNGPVSKSREQNLLANQDLDTRAAPTPLRRVTSLLDLNI